MSTYPKMNKQIVGILRWSDKPAILYAAARIEELEAERDALRKACEAYLADHDNDIAGLCRDAGIQPSKCDCGPCKQARAALGKSGEGT